jgi:hypothetical protein
MSIMVELAGAAGRPCEPLHIAGGGAGYCAIRVDGRVACWGGDISSVPPYAPAPAGRFHNVSVGSYVSCGVREDGSAACWAMHYSEELEGKFLQVSVADYFGVHAIREDGTLDYLPFEGNGEEEVPEGTFVQMEHGCAIHTDRTLQCMDGTVPLPGEFESVSGPCAIADDGQLRCWGGWEEIVDAPATEVFRHVSSSSGFSPIRSGYGICAVTLGGSGTCWGNNLITEQSPQEKFREVAYGYGWPWGLTTDSRLVPWAPLPEPTAYDGTAAPLVGTFAQIAAGGDGARPLSCGVESSGRLHCWGNNQFGQVLAPDGDFVEVGVGAYHACAIKSDHTIECWGNEDNLRDTDAPAGTFQSLAIGWFGPNCAMRTNGTIACWGYGELVLDVPAGTFETLTASGEIACALDDEGIPTCWRYVYGETQDDIVYELVEVPSGTFAEIANYFDGGPSWQNSHVCGRRPNGQVTCWTDEEDLDPWTAPGGTFSKLAPSGAAACGLRSNGAIECWGPAWVDDYLPPPEGEFVAVASGGGQVCGLATDGTVVCTGHDQTVSLCAPSLLCGNGDIDDSESCDDGDASFAPGDACTGGCWNVPCGQPIHPEAEGPVASDALFALRAAVGSSSCALSVCDVDDSSLVTASDALAILKKTVDPNRMLSCG